MSPRPPLPPFNAETAAQKIRMAEDAWNSRDPVRVSLAYTEDSVWRNRDEFFTGRAAIVEFLARKWAKEQEYRLIKELWRSTGTILPCGFSMSSTTQPGSGGGLMAMKTGNSTKTG